MQHGSLFVPADNKLEAVARISALTNSGPETLGPGSKERKSVLVNLARGLSLDIDLTGTKQNIARLTANALGATWTDDCQSIGQTITLVGLNLLLEHATIRLHWNLGEQTSQRFATVVEEARAIVDVIVDCVPKHWDGRASVQEMRAAESNNWRQTEWQGWYLEFKTLPHLVNRLGGGPVRYLNTKFDYALDQVWDLKAHSVKRTRRGWSQGQAQLNDQEAMQLASADRGLGLVVLSGLPDFNDEQFTDWHRALRGSSGETRRALKSGFTPVRVDAYSIPNMTALNRAVSNGQLKEFRQGHQPSGEPRRPKYSLDVAKSLGSDLQVYEYEFA